MVKRIYHLDRGFERLEEKLKACGASIARAPLIQATEIRSVFDADIRGSPGRFPTR